MKNLAEQLSVLILLALILFCIGCEEGQSCKQESCTENDSDNVRGLNGFDFNPGSDYYNQVVANFKFTQTTTTYKPPNERSICPSQEYAVKLQITNETNKIIHFDYNISYVLNFASWNYQDVVTINPLSVVEVGQISNNGASISLGQITIQSTNITYQ
jgi:hypothetical protein